MEEKRVNVLLSAYQGEAYIAEQIDSILAQSYKNIEIYVRDDGSKDQTKAILKPYADQGRIHLIVGENIGFIESFFFLVENCGDGDYFAYADQDDVWLPGKIRMAVEKMDREDNSRPLLYFSNYDLYNSTLQFQEHRKASAVRPSFYNALVDCMPLGFHSVFNQRACELLRKNMPRHSCGHDWWTYLLCAGLGTVIYDDRVTVKYRRHETNVSAAGTGFIKFQIWRFQKFFRNNYFKNVQGQTQEFAGYYEKRLKPEDRKVLRLFLDEKYHLGHMLQKVCYPKRFRRGIVDEIMVRIIFLLGKL
ncbi:glycosyltransferase [Lachnospiraceae bacterium ZAX-1]